MRNLYRKKGLTLIESLVAVFLVLMTLVSILEVFTMGRFASSGARTRMLTINHLRKTMEGIKSKTIPLGVYDPCTINDRGTPDDPSDDIISTEFYSYNEGREHNCDKPIVVIKWAETRLGSQVNLEESLSTLTAFHFE